MMTKQVVWERAWVIPVALFILAIAFRLYCLDCYSLWYDEIASLSVAQGGFDSIFNDRFGWLGNQPPLHYLIVWLTTLAADPANTSFFVRLPSVLAGALTVPVTYALGVEFFGRAQGMMAALLVALSPVMIDYSQDLRPYSMLAFLTVLSIYTLVLAVRTNKPVYWLIFTVATVLNLFNSYMAFILVLPAMVLPGLWFAWRIWTRRTEHPPAIYFGLGSSLVIGITAVLVYLDISRIPRTAPDLTNLSLFFPVNYILQISSWATAFGPSAQSQPIYGQGFLALAIIGLLGAVLNKEWEGVYLCGSMLFVSIVVLSVASSNTVAFERYVLFIVPFFYMLIVRGAFVLVNAIQRLPVRPQTRPALRIIASAVPVLIAIPFFVGAISFSTPIGHSVMSARPDFRGVAAYLVGKLGPQDIAVFIDEPAFGVIVCDFYWHGAPPAGVYDARDPRLASVHPTGDIYWVSTSYVPEAPAGGKVTYVDEGQFESVKVLHEEHPGIDMTSALDRVTSFLFPGSDAQATHTLLGSIKQMRGDVSGAIADYETAGDYFPHGGLGEVYDRTVEGLVSRGRARMAWNEAVLFKFLEPQQPRVHIWLSRFLAEMGYHEQSDVERKISEQLPSSDSP